MKTTIEESIVSIKHAYVDDDFIHNRVTLKIDFKEFTSIMKLYYDGRLCNYEQGYDPYEYYETEVTTELPKNLVEYINIFKEVINCNCKYTTSRKGDKIKIVECDACRNEKINNIEVIEPETVKQ